MAIIALATWRTSLPEEAHATAFARGRLQRVSAAIARAVCWLEALQNSDGGWGAFDRDNNMELLCKVPFADHNAMIDPSSPDLAGRVLEAFGKVGLRIGHRRGVRLRFGIGCGHSEGHRRAERRADIKQRQPLRVRSIEGFG